MFWEMYIFKVTYVEGLRQIDEKYSFRMLFFVINAKFL